MYILPKKKGLDINNFSEILELKLTSSSYKIYWLYGILEEIKMGNKNLTFKDIVDNMICKAWYSILEFKLSFGPQDRLGEIVKFLYKKHNLSKTIKEKELKKILFNLDCPEYEKMRKNLFNLVPYRLISPFYDELIGIKDNLKNKMIIDLSNKSDKGLYKLKGEELEINKAWFNYLYKHQVIIEGWIKFKLVCYLQVKNPNVPSIIFKLEAAQKRKLNKATKFWEGLIQNYEIKDIYTGEILTVENMSIDHFIPWSFVLHDELWNLIPTSKSTNSIKNNRLPNLDEHLENLINLLYFAFDLTIKSGEIKKLEDFLNINGIQLIKMSKEEFKDLLEKTINPLHQLAYNQGFSMWNY